MKRSFPELHGFRRYRDSSSGERDPFAAQLHPSWACAAKPKHVCARMLTRLLISYMPYIAGCEIRDHPLRPICRQCRDKMRHSGEDTPIAWLHLRRTRYVEKLATPDVTIADMIGDIDPIKAARTGQDISNELTIHYGLLPRANRGLFVVNELPGSRRQGAGRAFQHHARR